MKMTPDKINAAKLFFDAFEEFKRSTPADRAAAELQLDLAIIGYRKAHGLSDALGLYDLIVHFNFTHA